MYCLGERGKKITLLKEVFYSYSTKSKRKEKKNFKILKKRWKMMKNRKMRLSLIVVPRNPVRMKKVLPRKKLNCDIIYFYYIIQTSTLYAFLGTRLFSGFTKMKHSISFILCSYNTLYLYLYYNYRIFLV